MPGQDAVLPDVRVAIEARPEFVVGPETVERGGSREELRRGGEDERPGGVQGDEGRRLADPGDDDADLGAPDGALAQQGVQTLLEGRGRRRLRGPLRRMLDLSGHRACEAEADGRATQKPRNP